MAITIAIVLIGILSLIYYIEKSIAHPMAILLLEWSIIFILCSINIYNYRVSDKAYVIIFLGLISCVLGYFFYKSKIKIKNKSKEEITFSNIKLYIIFVIEVIMLIILILYYRNVKDLINSGISYGDIRYSYLKEVIGKFPVLNILFSYLIRPFGILMMPLSVYLLIKDGRKITKCIFIIELANVLLITIVMGERMYLFYYVAFLGLTYLCIRKAEGKKLSKRFRKILVSAIAIFVGVFCFISYSRMASENSGNKEESLSDKVQDTLYLYFSGCVSHLSYKIDEFDSSTKSDKYTYGFTSFQGVIRPIHQIIEIVHSENNTSDSLFYKADDRKKEIESAVLIGGSRFNGYISMFYYFYVDFNFLGVIIFSFLISIWINMMYSYYVLNRTVYNLIRYLLAASIFMFSFFQFMLSNLDMPMAFVYFMIFFIPRIKNKNE